uniref:Plectrovirus SVGII3 orf 7 transmembrane protein n=1 Tax=Spiroplasma citri TaxID=2133 RepID=Q14KV3_SPICI|nr:plectrovirus SVGII3 orf 7 transmembrane protein [Spiroplasma citri]
MNLNLLTGDADVIKQIADFAAILANWAIAFTNWFIAFLGSHMLLITPLFLMFVVLGIQTIRKLIHGY